MGLCKTTGRPCPLPSGRQGSCKADGAIVLEDKDVSPTEHLAFHAVDNASVQVTLPDHAGDEVHTCQPSPVSEEGDGGLGQGKRRPLRRPLGDLFARMHEAVPRRATADLNVVQPSVASKVQA